MEGDLLGEDENISEGGIDAVGMEVGACEGPKETEGAKEGLSIAGIVGPVLGGRETVLTSSKFLLGFILKSPSTPPPTLLLPRVSLSANGHVSIENLLTLSCRTRPCGPVPAIKRVSKTRAEVLDSGTY